MSDPAFEDIVAFLMDFARPPQDPISSSTRLEADLGITGDDGDELLEAAAKRFDAELALAGDGYRTTFGLAQNEFLFNSEGMDLLHVGDMVRWLRHEPPAVVTDLTVGELHAAILRARRTDERHNHALQQPAGNRRLVVDSKHRDVAGGS